MESLCIRFYKGGHIDEEEEEIIVDYLSHHHINVNLDTPLERMCYLALKHKLGGKTAANQFIKSLSEDKEEIYSEPIIANKYGDVDINTYLKIALEVDDETLLNMIKTSKIHLNKFDDKFFLAYMQKHYPNLISHKPFLQSYKQYYLSVIYSISKLKEEYNFIYSPEQSYDVVTVFKSAQRIKKTLPSFLENYLSKFR